MYSYREAVQTLSNINSFVRGVEDIDRSIKEIYGINKELFNIALDIIDPTYLPMDELDNKVRCPYHLYIKSDDFIDGIESIGLESRTEIKANGIRVDTIYLASKSNMYKLETAKFMHELNERYTDYLEITGIDISIQTESLCKLVFEVSIEEGVLSQSFKDLESAFEFMGKVLYNEVLAILKVVTLSEEVDSITFDELNDAYNKYSVIDDQIQVLKLLDS